MSFVPQYPVGTRVLHKRTGGVYEVKGFCRSVENLEICYIYVPIDKAVDAGLPWLRRAASMEDGRYEVVK